MLTGNNGVILSGGESYVIGTADWYSVAYGKANMLRLEHPKAIMGLKRVCYQFGRRVLLNDWLSPKTALLQTARHSYMRAVSL